MADVDSIDSSVVGLRYAVEDSPKVVSGNETWYPLEPNSFGDFGAQIGTTPRNPFTQSRQRKKGPTTSLSAVANFNMDLTQTNLQDLLQGFFYADLRPKGEQVVTLVDVDGGNPDEYEVASTAGFLVGSLIQGQGFTNAANNAVNQVTAIVSDTSVEVATGLLVGETPPADAQIVVVGHVGAADDLDVTTTGDFATITSSVLDFTTLGLIPGEWIFVGAGALLGFSNAANNGFKRIRSIAANALVVDKSDAAMITEVSAGGRTVHLYFGRVLKNEASPALQVRRTYQLERAMGAPDDANLDQLQAEYVVGAYPDALTWNHRAENKVDLDLSFIALDEEIITAAAPPNLKSETSSGGAPDIEEADAFNTTSDYSRIRLGVYEAGVEAPASLYSFASELTIEQTNNHRANPGLGVLGAAVVSKGKFQVGGTANVYFTDFAAKQAVRNNDDATLDLILVKSNAGIALDLPLVSLGDARPQLEEDAPVRLPISFEAATGAKYLSTMDHTMLLVFFDYLPDAADL